MYGFYNVPKKNTLSTLMKLSLIKAKQHGADVFNALDIMNNEGLFEELKFGVGDGSLHYYLYNWALSTPTIKPKQLGMVLV